MSRAADSSTDAERRPAGPSLSEEERGRPPEAAALPNNKSHREEAADKKKLVIAITTLGLSRGEAQPYVAATLALQRAGHDATLLTSDAAARDAEAILLNSGDNSADKTDTASRRRCRGIFQGADRVRATPADAVADVANAANAWIDRHADDHVGAWLDAMRDVRPDVCLVASGADAYGLVAAYRLRIPVITASLDAWYYSSNNRPGVHTTRERRGRRRSPPRRPADDDASYSSFGGIIEAYVAALAGGATRVAAHGSSMRPRVREAFAKRLDFDVADFESYYEPPAVFPALVLQPPAVAAAVTTPQTPTSGGGGAASPAPPKMTTTLLDDDEDHRCVGYCVVDEAAQLRAMAAAAAAPAEEDTTTASSPFGRPDTMRRVEAFFAAAARATGKVVYLGWPIVPRSPGTLLLLAARALRASGLHAIILGTTTTTTFSMDVLRRACEGEIDGAGVVDFAADRCLFLDNAPHEALFKRCACVVHHGGVGTTAAALRAGVPQVVAPAYAPRHFDSATAVRRLGCGHGFSKSLFALDATELGRAIARCVYDDDVVRQARDVAVEAIRREDGNAGVVRGVGDFWRDAVRTGAFDDFVSSRLAKRELEVVLADEASVGAYDLRASTCGFF